MRVDTYLEQFIRMNEIINEKLERLFAIRDAVCSCTPGYGCEAVQHTRNVHSHEAVMAKMADLEREIDADIDEFADKKAELKKHLAKIGKVKCEQALWLRYGECKTWAAVSAELGCTKRHAIRLGQEGMALLEKIF